MQAERDYLARVVFPELREKMKALHLHLVDLDLRWGVTEEEAEEGKVLEVILREIDRSRPFFIGILGERYGSVANNVPEQTQQLYPWLLEYNGYSFTSLEIVYGVLHNPKLAKHSFFYFRDPVPIAKIPENKRGDFEPENLEASQKLVALKNNIRSSGVNVTENYQWQWDEKNRRVAGLEVFGEKVLDDFWTAICEEYPADAREVDSIYAERQMHEVFVEERTCFHIGRTDQTAELTQYIQGDDHRPIVITGESGCGKSAFLANWYRQYTRENPDDFVLAYFIGASPNSTNHYQLLRNMCKEIKHIFDLKEEIPQEDKKLSETISQMLVHITSGSSSAVYELNNKLNGKTKVPYRVIILLDALDQLLPLEAAYGLGWLLDYIPLNVQLVVSTLESECLDVLRRRGSKEILLEALSVNEQRQIILTLLESWGRKLNDKQISALLAQSEAKKPLYLRVALEELRLFGKFELLTQRISYLPSSITELFDQVLVRLEEDNGAEFVESAFSFTGCSRYGLSETELLDLLSTEKMEPVPRVLWTRLTFGAKLYLVQRGEFFGFFHRQLSDAVKMRYSTKGNRHAQLAEYFSRSPFDRRVDEFPFQLQHAENWEGLATALSDLDLLQYAWNNNREYEWISYWLSVKGCFEPEQYYQTALYKRIKAQGECQNNAYLASIIGLLLAAMAQYAKAKLFHQQALMIRESTLGANHPDVATSLSHIAVLNRAQGMYDEALPLCNRALEIREKTLGANHPDVATSLDNLSGVYYSLGRYDEALPLLERALRIRESNLGINHSHVAMSLAHMARHYYSLGKYDKALPICYRALKIRESTLVPNHPEVGASLDNLGAIYSSIGRYDEALPLLERALKIREVTLGKSHSHVAISLAHLALIYCALGRWDEALPLMQRALKIRESTLGPNHREVAASLDNLAGLYTALGRYDDALPLLERALKICEVALGSKHPDTENIRQNLKACSNKINHRSR